MRAEGRDRADPDDDAADADRSGRVAVELAHARGAHLRWTLVGGALGIACIVMLGTLGKGLGVLLLLLAAWAAFKLFLTYRHPAGTIIVEGDEVALPRGLCRGAPNKVKRSSVTAAYFLRRSVPWTKAAPVLVVEADGKAYAYPRDWFASEADQRRVLDALAAA
jgi:hypothetical protein